MIGLTFALKYCTYASPLLISCPQKPPFPPLAPPPPPALVPWLPACTLFSPNANQVAQGNRKHSRPPQSVPLSNVSCTNFTMRGVRTQTGSVIFLQCSGTQRRTCLHTDLLAHAPPPRCGACVACPGEGFQYLFTIPVSRFFLSILACQTEKKKKNQLPSPWDTATKTARGEAVI